MKFEHSTITSLLEKHSLGLCTPEERALLEQWYASFPAEGPLWDSAEEKAAMKEALKAELFDAIAPVHTLASTSSRTPRKLWWQVAAAAVLLAVFLLYNLHRTQKVFDYVVLTAPAGAAIHQFQLPDGSEVWLEPGTTLQYRDDFGENGRAIELLNGMAYFSVRKHMKQPFLVQTPKGIQTKVLGTQFTVKAYPQTKEVQVMVSEGIVQVADSTHVLGTLTADQQLSYQLETHATQITTGAPDDWRSGNHAFRNASFAEVVYVLENRYGLKVTYTAADVAAYRFTLRINKNTTAAELLETVKDISGLPYTLAGNRVTIH